MSGALAVGVAACAVAALALVAVLLLWGRVRKLRSAQAVVLGTGSADLLDFAVSLQGRVDDLHRAVDEVAAGLSRVDRRVDGSAREGGGPEGGTCVLWGHGPTL